MKNDRCRIFVGLDLSGHLVRTIPMVKSTVEDRKRLINWVSGRNLHLTLSFVGNINAMEINKLKAELNDISNFKSFNIDVNGTGAFPSFEKPKPACKVLLDN